MALSAFNNCGFDVVGAIDSLAGDEALKLAVGVVVAQDGAENGILESVANLHARFYHGILPSDSKKMASSLSKSFTPGESTMPDETQAYKETLANLNPAFSVPGSTERMSLLNNMNDSTLAMLSQDDNYVKETSLIQMLRQGAETANDSITRAYGTVAV